MLQRRMDVIPELIYPADLPPQGTGLIIEPAPLPREESGGDDVLPLPRQPKDAASDSIGRESAAGTDTVHKASPKSRETPIDDHRDNAKDGGSSKKTKPATKPENVQKETEYPDDTTRARRIFESQLEACKIGEDSDGNPIVGYPIEHSERAPEHRQAVVLTLSWSNALLCRTIQAAATNVGTPDTWPASSQIWGDPSIIAYSGVRFQPPFAGRSKQTLKSWLVDLGRTD